MHLEPQSAVTITEANAAHAKGRPQVLGHSLRHQRSEKTAVTPRPASSPSDSFQNYPGVSW